MSLVWTLYKESLCKNMEIVFPIFYNYWFKKRYNILHKCYVFYMEKSDYIVPSYEEFEPTTDEEDLIKYLKYMKIYLTDLHMEELKTSYEY
jgi:hypothetical protein